MTVVLALWSLVTRLVPRLSEHPTLEIEIALERAWATRFAVTVALDAPAILGQVVPDS